MCKRRLVDLVKLPASRWPSCLWATCPSAPGEGVGRRGGAFWCPQRARHSGGCGGSGLEERVASHSGLWHSPPAATNATPSSHPCAKRPWGVVNGLLWVCCVVCVRVLPLGQDTSRDEAEERNRWAEKPQPMPQTEQKRTAQPHHTGHTKQERVWQRKALSSSSSVIVHGCMLLRGGCPFPGCCPSSSRRWCPSS